ncbi:MAG TPA: DUF2703 domain-containing protein [candidate division Zixibacteria bacterium]|nr:DUF2703 domain-containing protein [candidate division Zixibacteria bacterium]
MKSLHILWQRLVTHDGQTCERCGATGGSLERALAKLEKSLEPLGVKPVLETKEIDEETFKRDPSASNRIWVAGRSLEEWLGATVGGSRCCSVCGDSECRTVEVGGEVFEAVPEELILKAALLAAAEMLAPAEEAGKGGEKAGPACCPGSR